ncbi:Bulb-type lectin domain [Sesbania bispinosa]|nr:Bulb-type lectin domain [Sesbania bispinosa]
MNYDHLSPSLSTKLPTYFIFFLNPNRDSPVSQDAILELDTTGNLVLMDKDITTWASNTSGVGVVAAAMAESGNFILHNTIFGQYAIKFQDYSLREWHQKRSMLGGTLERISPAGHDAHHD